MPPDRTLRRIRQACEPCRRKKCKCPGEKPICSHCARLAQNCIYASEDPPEADQGAPALNQARLELLEAKLEAVLQAVGTRDSSPRSRVRNETDLGGSPASVQMSSWTRSVGSTLPPWELIMAAGELYLQYCDCQPLPLFHRPSFMEALHSRSPEVLFSILAITARFSDHDFFRYNVEKYTNEYMEAAREIVMRSVFEGSVRLSTLQSLCLLSLLDFTCGNTHRASLSNSLAMDLAHSAGLTAERDNLPSDNRDKEERRRCFWSIFLCKRLHGADFSSLDFSVEADFPWYPESLSQPSLQSPTDSEAEQLNVSQQHSMDTGIIAYMIQLSEVWFKTTRYARRRGKPHLIPPWSPQSEYSTIVAQQMNFETRMPYIHRFKPARFDDRTSQELDANRSYWSPWLFIQFLYHTNICLLNHPLLLSLRLRNFRNVIPEIFLQQTSDLISSHATWVVRFIDMIEKKSYKISDPFLGHCAAIVATIHLQQSFVAVDDAPRQEKQRDFTKCLKFIQIMGGQWPHMAMMADKLRGLERAISATDHASQSPRVPTRGMLIDLSRFWEILEYCAASARPGSAQLVLAPELYNTLNGPTTDVSDTSPLPDTFRLEDYRGGSHEVDNMNTDIDGSEAENTRDDTNMSRSDDWLISRGFSEDELAVLADNFFGHTSAPMLGLQTWGEPILSTQVPYTDPSL